MYLHRSLYISNYAPLRAVSSLLSKSYTLTPWISAACHNGSIVEDGQPSHPMPMLCSTGTVFG